MWTLSQIVCMGMLVGLSAMDIQARSIPAKCLCCLNIMVVLYQLYTQELDLILIAGGCFVGMLFFIISRFTGESIGYADCWLVLILGIYLGIWGTLEVLMNALFLLAIASIILLIKRKMSRKCTIPFIPFLAAGYLLSRLTDL